MSKEKGHLMHFLPSQGDVKTSGGSEKLPRASFALVDISKGVEDGAKIISTVAGFPRRKKMLRFEQGVGFYGDNMRSDSNKGFASPLFSLEDVDDLTVSAPTKKGISVDSITLGYDGIHPETAFKFNSGDAYFAVDLELDGKALAFATGGDGACRQLLRAVVPMPKYNPADKCTEHGTCEALDCRKIVQELIDTLYERPLNNHVTLRQSGLVDIAPILSCDNAATATTTTVNYYNLEVVDFGDARALAAVETQYTFPVKAIKRVGVKTTYEALGTALPSAFSQSNTALIKGCETCPSGYTAATGGYVYTFTIEDAGVDKSTTFTALTNYVTGTIYRAPGHEDGRGAYTAVFSAQITDAAITTLVTGAAPNNTITVNLLGKVEDVCTPGAATTTAWAPTGKTCTTVNQKYHLTLPNDDCNTSGGKLTSLQAAYPSLTITTATDQLRSSKTLTLSGGAAGAASELTMTSSILGISYTIQVAYSTDLTTTAADFVTTNKAILLTKGIEVTSTGAVITFKAPTEGFPTMTFVAKNAVSPVLAGAFGALTDVSTALGGGCRTVYEATVTSEIVCADCDPIYKKFYETTAPAEYNGEKWILQDDGSTTPDGNCLCGIKITAKKKESLPTEALRAKVPFYIDAVRLNAVARFPLEIIEGIGNISSDAPYQATYLSRFEPMTHLFGDLFSQEAETMRLKGNFHQNNGNYLETVIRYGGSFITDDMMTQQYIQYVLHLKDTNSEKYSTTDLTFKVPYGKHKPLENLLNDLASNAGIDPVKANIQ